MSFALHLIRLVKNSGSTSLPAHMPEYRQAIGSVVWHSHSSCTTWPRDNFVVSENPLDGESCPECTALHALRVRTCPVIVNQKTCGLELIRNSDGLFYCPVGHRTRIVE